MSKTADRPTYPGNETEGFYSRWSKRKRQARSSQLDEIQDSTATQTADAINPSADCPVNQEPGEDKAVLSDCDMPDLDTLTEDSDYSCFFSSGVSEKLRKLALRKLFQGQSFNLCDGLDDYDEEYTSFETLGDIVTADMRFQLEQQARQKLLAEENSDIENTAYQLALLDEDSTEIESPVSTQEPQNEERSTATGSNDFEKYNSQDNEKRS